MHLWHAPNWIACFVCKHLQQLFEWTWDCHTMELNIRHLSSLVADSPWNAFQSLKGKVKEICGLRTSSDQWWHLHQGKMALCADMWWSSGLQERFPAPDVINPLLSNLTLSWIKSFSWAIVVNELKTLQHTDKHTHTHSNISYYVKNLMSRGPMKRPANQLLSCLFAHSTECLLEWDWFLHRTSRQMQNDCFCYEGNQKPVDYFFVPL